MTFTVPKDQPFGEMILEVRGGGVVPLPYLIQQQKYNLTDEIINRLHVYKDFDELHTKLLKEDQNNKSTDKNPSYLKGKESGREKEKEKE